MLQTLGLDDDDGSDALLAVLKAFDVKMSAAEALQVYTVGDLFGILRDKIQGNDNRKCARSMAFYRIRSALNDLSGNPVKSPSHDLTPLRRVYTKPFVKSFEEKYGLRLPPPAFGLLGKIGVAFALGGTLGCLALLVCKVATIWLPIPIKDLSALVPITTLLGGWIVGCVLMRIDPGRLPSDCRTLGDLATKSATLSYGRLVELGADARDIGLWQALVETLADFAHLPADRIAPETYILQRSVTRVDVPA